MTALDPSFQYLLQTIANGGRSNGPANTDLAKFVLANSSIKFNTPSPINLGETNKPSLLGRVIDVLSRPNYAVANMFHSAARQHNPLVGFWRGLAGEDKTTFSKVLGEDFQVTNPWAKGLGGFALDVALDPTTYIGAGTIKKGLGALGKKAGVVKAVKDLPIKPIEELPSAVAASKVYKTPTDFGQFFKGAGKGSKVALPREHKLIQQASDVVPDAAPKAKPEINLTPYEQDLAEEHLTKIPKSKAKINIKSPDTVNPRQQVAIWDKLLEQAKDLHPKKPAEQFDKTYQMMQHIENQLEATGKKLRYWDGSNLKLTDVIAEMNHGKGVKFTRETMPKITADLFKTGNLRYGHPEVAQSIHNVRVRNALLDSPKIKEAVDSVLQEKKSIGELPASDAHIKQLFKSLPALAQRHVANLEGSVAGIGAVKDLTAEILKKDVPLHQRAIANSSHLTQHALEYGDTKFGPKINSSLTNALLKTIDVSHAAFKAPMNGLGKPYDTFMGRLFSWYGQKDLRPITEQHLLTATNSAWLRDASIKRVAENYPREQQLQAIRFAQGLDNTSSQLGIAFKTALENLFKGSGLKDAAWHGTTVAERAGLLMDRLNKHLAYVKSPYKFTRGKVKNPITGEIHDFSKGTDWLNSWQAWDIKEPLDFFNKIQGAVEQAAHEKALFDEIGERFGSTVAGNGYHNKINYPYLHGYLFTDDIAKQIPKVVHDIDTFFTTGANSPFLKTFDKISRVWKFTVTLPNPSHHIHNLLGDAYMSWMAGVRGVMPYQHAARIMRSQRNMYKDLNDLENLVSAGAVDKAMGKTVDAKDVLFSNGSGHPFTAEQVYVAANKMGILPQAHVIEDILGGNEPLTKFQPFGGHVKAKLEHFSESREHFARLAHFADAIRRSRGSDYESIFRKAGYEVRKWHPDYLTLTPFEKKYLRRIMPFYSWTRRAIPLIIESAIMNPGKTLAYPKLMQGVQTTQGVDTPSRENPFPNDQMFPQWIRDKGIGPIFKEPAWGARSITGPDGQPYGQTIVNPSNPMFDLFGQFSNPVSGFGSMLSPALKIPIELLSGKQLFNNAPINKDNFSEYIGNNLPYWPLAQGMLGVTPTLGNTNRAEREGSVNTERLINWLTSLGVRGTGPYIKQAEFEQKAGG